MKLIIEIDNEAYKGLVTEGHIFVKHIFEAVKNGTPIPDNATNEFYVIDKRTGKEPIFDHNHIFKEKWFKESGLIWCDIDGWYISEDGTLVLVDDCGKVAYPPIDRFEIVYDVPTVCDIEQIRAEIIKQFEGCYLEEDMTDERKAEHKAYKNVLQIIDKYRE